jgi:DNA-binding CsgD family transcriptional regulator
LRRGRRFGWEDLAISLCETNLPLGRRTLGDLQEHWPTGPRADAARHYVTGLLDGGAGHAALLESAESFAALPEPLSAGRAFHAAARTAPDASTGNQLRERAVELLQGCGADRSMASVLRDRRLRRTASSPRIPESQRHAPSTGFTRREHQVAALAQRGLTAREIATELSISTGTARNHLFRIREKLGGVPKRRLVELFGQDTGE